MYPKLNWLSGDTGWIVLIFAFIISFVFFSLYRIEKKKSSKTKSKLYYIFTVLFYLSVAATLVTLITQITGQTVNSYGLMLAIAFVIGVSLLLHNAKRLNIPEGPLLDICIWGVLLSIVGARLFYMLFEYQYQPLGKALLEPPYAFFQNPTAFIDISSGGLVVYGGFLFGITFALIFIKIRRLPLGKVADLFAPVLAMGVGFARTGCNLAGCCWGLPLSSDHPLALALSHFKAEAPVRQFYASQMNMAFESTYVWPAQIISALNGFILFAILLFIYYKYRDRFKFNGLLFLIFLMLYSVTRFLIEFIRNDTDKSFFGLSAAQFIGIFVFLIAVILMVYNYYRIKKPTT